VTHHIIFFTNARHADFQVSSLNFSTSVVPFVGLANSINKLKKIFKRKMLHYSAVVNAIAENKKKNTNHCWQRLRRCHHKQLLTIVAESRLVPSESQNPKITVRLSPSYNS
jgi:hypothetical protein